MAPRGSYSSYQSNSSSSAASNDLLPIKRESQSPPTPSSFSQSQTAIKFEELERQDSHSSTTSPTSRGSISASTDHILTIKRSTHAQKVALGPEVYTFLDIVQVPLDSLQSTPNTPFAAPTNLNPFHSYAVGQPTSPWAKLMTFLGWRLRFQPQTEILLFENWGKAYEVCDVSTFQDVAAIIKGRDRVDSKFYILSREKVVNKLGLDWLGTNRSALRQIRTLVTGSSSHIH